ncbi:MAG: RNA polymerase sigma factor [Acidobacteriota bacterium]
MEARHLDPRQVEQLHRLANAARWGLATEAFHAALEAAVHRGVAATGADRGTIERYAGSLHLADLALACACAEGLDAAWEEFIRRFRPVLYRAADAIDPTGRAREAADSLYADLFGFADRDGQRRSLFRYYHGRSSLATWLRAVLAQRHVDGIRAARKFEPLPEGEDRRMAAAPASTPDPHWPRLFELMRRAVRDAVSRLDPRDRLRLTSYYAQDLTLAQIGKCVGEHEATVSRHLARARRFLREQVERTLQEEAGLSRTEIDDCLATFVRDPGRLDVRDLLEEPWTRKAARANRSK